MDKIWSKLDVDFLLIANFQASQIFYETVSSQDFFGYHFIMNDCLRYQFTLKSLHENS